MKETKLILYVLLISFLGLYCVSCVSVSAAHEYHVSKKGSDTKGNGSLSNSWNTIGYALSRIKGGDIITIHEGVYNEYDLRIPFSGTKEAPTTIRAAKDEQVIIDGKQDLFSKRYVFYLVSDKNNKPLHYVTISGLEITGGWGGGNIQVGGGPNHCCSHITIKDCEIWNRGGKEFASHNPSLVRFSSTRDCKIVDCTLRGDDERTSYRTAIKIWRETSYLTVEHNEIYAVGLKGIDNKHGGPGRHLIIRYNYINDLGENSIGINLNGDHSTIAHNLVVNCKIGMLIYSEAGGPGGSFSRIDHNTIVGCGTGIVLGETRSQKLTNCTVTNNLLINSTNRVMPELIITAYRAKPYNHNHTIDFNCYYNSKYDKSIRYYGKRLFSLYEWQKFSGLDIHSLNASPNFQVADGCYSYVCNYRVGETSKAFRAALDRTNIGADVYSLAKGMCPPQVPINLTIIKSNVQPKDSQHEEQHPE